MEPKLSVIVCVYNEGTCILDALKSLLANQIYPETEIILVDDCSTNPVTVRILSLLEKYTRTKIIRSEKNLGLSNSRNLGFAHATSEYVLPLDADDIFPPNSLDIIYQTFTDNPQIDFIAGNYIVRNVQDNHHMLMDFQAFATDGYVDSAKLSSNWQLLGTSPCKKSVWQKISGYSLKYSYSVQDVDFWIRALQAQSKGFYLSKPIYIWNKSQSGMNTNFDRIDMTKLLDDHKEFYLQSYKRQRLYNQIFEGYYPYKQKRKLITFGKKYFIYLTYINKARLIYLCMLGLFERNEPVIK